MTTATSTMRERYCRVADSRNDFKIDASKRNYRSKCGLAHYTAYPLTQTQHNTPAFTISDWLF